MFVRVLSQNSRTVEGYVWPPNRQDEQYITSESAKQGGFQALSLPLSTTSRKS